MSWPAPPGYPRPLVGRDVEVGTLVDLLLGDAVRLVTLTGPGGVGKTRLAAEVAARMAGSLADGAAWVDLSSIADARLVGETIASALDAATEGGAPEQAIASALHDRDLLLVIDNFEHVLDAAPLVSALLASCHRLRVLTTSREPLRLSWEREVPLAPLATPPPDQIAVPATIAAYPAVALFAERARAAGADFALTEQNAASVAELSRRLDGLPLAIELAAARARALPPDVLLGRSDVLLGLLDAGGRDGPARHRGLTAAIDWSHALLSAVEQAVFHRLAVFAGGWTAEAAEAICSPSAAMATIASLVDRSLVVAPEAGAPSRYRLLVTIRAYAAARLAESRDDRATRDRHAAYYLAAAEAAVERLEREGSRVPVAALEPDVENLRAALAWLVEREDVAAAYRLGDALGRVLEQIGRLREGVSMLARLLDGTETAADSAPERVRALLTSFQLHERLGDLPAARTRLLEVLDLQRVRGDRAGEALALSWLGSVARDQGASAEARSVLEASGAIYRELGDEMALAMVLDRLGTVAHASGDLSGARRFYAESEALLRSPLRPQILCWSLHNQALLGIDRGDPALALRLARESVTLRRQIDDRSGLVYSLALFAALAVAGDGKVPAAAAAERALRLGGAVTSIAAESGLRLMPAYRARFEEALTAARRVLTDVACQRAVANGAALSLEQALADATDVEVPVQVHADDPLSPREREVAALIARGATNREIAVRLVLSVRTVDRHVANALRKIGLRTRSQLAAWIERS